MKRIFCILFLVAGIMQTALAQNVTFNGTYKGKAIKITYVPTNKALTKGEIIEIQYKPYSDLEKEVSTLKSEKGKLEKDKTKLEQEKAKLEQKKAELEQENKKIKKQKEGRVTDCDTSELISRINAFKNQLALKQLEYDNVNARLEKKEQELVSMDSELKQLRKELENGQKNNQKRIEELVKENQDLRRLVEHRDLNDDVITASVLLGGDMFKNERVNTSPWTSSIVFVQQAELTYTHYFSKESPLAVRFGVGLSRLQGRASFGAANDTVMGLSDGDGDRYDARCSFRNVEEEANLRYLDIPLMLHLGNSYTSFGVQAWIEAGLRASIRIKSSFSGSGTYSVHGYYPDYNVEVSDIPGAGFVTDRPLPYSNSAEVNGFVLWGQLAAGLNIPLGKKLSLMLGVNGAYTLLPVSNGEKKGGGNFYELDENGLLQEKKNLLNGGDTRIVLAGIELGLNYKF